MGERPWPPKLERPPVPYAFIDTRTRRDELLPNGTVALEYDGTESLLDVLERALAARGKT